MSVVVNHHKPIPHRLVPLLTSEAGYVCDHDIYWREVETLRDRDGRLREPWVFDFISMHQTDRKFSLTAPMVLIVDRPRGKGRPFFETKEFDSWGACAKYARRLRRKLLNRGIRVHIVDCSKRGV